MDRRRFLKQSLIGASTLSMISANDGFPLGGGNGGSGRPLSAAERVGNKLTAEAVHDYLLSLGSDWVDPQRTVDTFKAGDPKSVVTGIAVGWMSYFGSLRKARELGCNLFITHEPTYYDHRDRDPSVFAFETAKRKKQFIEQSGMAVIRCHDVWDRVPEIGIRDAWARFLGFDKEVDARIAKDRANGRPFCGVYEIAPMEAGKLARQVAAKVAPYGQDSVLLIGPDSKLVRKVAVGTGAITPFREMVNDLQADIVICTDDGFSFWRDGSLAIDMEYPAIIVNHPCSEEIGMQNLAEHLARKYSPIPVHHIPQTCMFKSIRPDG